MPIGLELVAVIGTWLSGGLLLEEGFDVGRRPRTVAAGVRDPPVAPEGGCTFQGCNQPDSWSDAHHVCHLAERGPTSPANLVLLRSAHHHVVHLAQVLGAPSGYERGGPDLITDDQIRKEFVWVFRSSAGEEY